MNIRASVWTPFSLFLLMALLPSWWMPVSAQAMEMRLAAVQGPNMTYVRALSDIASEIEKRSGGQLRVKIHTNGRMGSERSALKRQINGRIHGGFTSAITLAHTLPGLRLLTIPRLFKSVEEVTAFPGSPLEQRMRSKSQRRNLKILGYASYGFYGVLDLHWGTRHDQSLPGNLYVRVPDESWMRTLHMAMGWRPVYAPMDDLKTATSSGWIEGLVATPESLAGAFPPEKNDYFHQIRQMHGWTVFTVNARWFNRLPQALKQAVEGAVQSVSARALGKALQREQDILRRWSARGWAAPQRSTQWRPSNAERKVALKAARRVELTLRLKGDVTRLWEQRNPSIMTTRRTVQP